HHSENNVLILSTFFTSPPSAPTGTSPHGVENAPLAIAPRYAAHAAASVRSHVGDGDRGHQLHDCHFREAHAAVMRPGAARQRAAGVEHHYMVGDAHYQRHVVLDQDDGEAGVREPAQHGTELGLSAPVSPAAGSSSSSTCGRMATARAISTRRWSAWGRCCAGASDGPAWPTSDNSPS